MQPPTIIHNHPQPLKKPPTTIHNHLQPSTKPPRTTQNRLQSPKSYPKNQNLSQTVICYCTLDANTETDVGFDSNMKQWYIYICACVSVYKLYIL